MKNSVIHVAGLGKRYTGYRSNFHRLGSWMGLPFDPVVEHWSVRDVNLTVNAGEAVAVIGANGAGKSTLLKMIAGTIVPSTGSIAVTGRKRALLELGTGFNPEFTGRENVYFAGGLQGMSSVELTEMMPAIEEFADIGAFFDQPLRTYSSGMQARVGFALATAVCPDVLIVDEILSVGDAFFQAKCYERIAQYRDRGMAMLLVTHSTGDVVKHCDRAVYIDKGVVQFDGSPREATNIFLDRLYGRKIAPEKDQPEEAPVRLLVDQDVFHTRPGYRKEEYRWGQGGARILDFSIRSQGQNFPISIKNNEILELSFSAAFDVDVEDVTAGMLIKSVDGLFLYGTNSFLASGACGQPSLAAGEVAIFTFRMPMRLNSGPYLLSVGVSVGPQEKLIPLDRRYDSALLMVEHGSSFWGVVDLEATFEAEFGSNLEAPTGTT
jgi:lipopolysaccharide transport system ATP-binding protein